MNNTEVPEFQDSELVPFDIETTGFDVKDEVTALTFYVDNTYYVFVNTGIYNLDDEGTEDTLLEQENINNAEVHSVSTEEELLVESKSVIDDVIEWDEYFITAYNGERWKGGFDLAFLRTVAARHDVDTPFSGLYYMDIYPIFEKERVNTVGPALDNIDEETKEGFHDLMDYAKWKYPEDTQDLTSEQLIERLQTERPSFSDIREWYETRSDFLCRDSLPTKRYKDLVMVHYLLSVELFGKDEEAYLRGDFDPFDHSKEAVTAYNEGNLRDIVLHNVADVQKTLELASFIEKVSEEDVKWRQIPW